MSTPGLSWNAVTYDIPLPRKQRKAALAAEAAGHRSSTDAPTPDVEKSPNESQADDIKVDLPDWMKPPTGQRRLLSDFKGHCGRGELCGIMGASGAGKVSCSPSLCVK